MVKDAPSDFIRITELQDEQDKMRDILFFESVHSQNVASIFGAGRKANLFGSRIGKESWKPIETLVNDINEIGEVVTGIFDRFDVQAITNIVDAAATPVIKFIQRVADGTIFTITPKTGKTVELQTGGNLDITNNITLTDKDVAIMQKFDDTGMVKVMVTGAGSGGGIVPPGTVENEHLEWDDTTKTWVAVQSMTHGATGPFAATGFHRFANNQIMLSARNAGDSGNVELKVDASDFFDFTRDDNGATTIRIRSQHAIDPDQSTEISQQSGTGGGAIFSNPNFYQWDVGATVLLVFDEPASGQGRIKFAGTPAFDRFQVAFETDTYFTGSGTPGRLNVVSSGTNVFTFQSDGASFLGTSKLFFNGGYIEFAGTAPTSGQVRFANDTIGLTWRGSTAFNVEMKVDTSGAFDFTRDDNGITNLKIRSQHAVNPDNILSVSQQSGTGGGAIFGNPTFYQFDVGATTLLVFDEPSAGEGRIKFAGTPAFDRFQIAFETDTYFTGSGTPGRLNVVSSGVNIFTFQTNGASFLGTANLFFNSGYIQMLERASDPTSVANTVQVYVKDVSGDSHLFARYDTVAGSTIVDIINGLGPTFPDNTFEIFDDITPTKKLLFSLATATGTNLFAIFGTSDTYTFPDGGGTIMITSLAQTISGIKTFTSVQQFNAEPEFNEGIKSDKSVRIGSTWDVRAQSGFIGLHVSSSTVTGSVGTVEIPVITTVDPSDATLDTQFGAVDGAIGLANANAANPKLQVRSNGNWSHVFLSNSN